MLYRITYHAGVQTMRLLHRTGRFLSLLFLPLLLFVRRHIGTVIHRAGVALRDFVQDVSCSFSHIGDKVGTAWRKHPLLGVKQVLLLPVEALFRYRRLTRLLLSLTAMAAAVALLIGTVRYWQDLSFALALETDGRVIGYVSGEEVLQQGSDKATGRLSGMAEKQMPEMPTLVLSMAHGDDLMDSNAVCDALLSRTEVPLTSACGIYVDGVYDGAVSDRNKASDLLQEILEDSCKGKGEVTASFFETVDLVEGLYPRAGLLSVEQMKDKLTAVKAEKELYEVRDGDTPASVSAQTGVSLLALKKLNPTLGDTLTVGQTLLIRENEPHLQVLVEGTTQYEVKTPYHTERVDDNAEYQGHQRVTVNGVEGINLITAKVTYLDDVPLYSTIVSSSVMRQPVTEIIACGTRTVGSKTYSGGSGATGRFIWPVPYTRHITCYYGRGGHGGIDINANGIQGADILAADGGTVVLAEYRKDTSYSSYGRYIVIDHGGGYRTLYAHCSELLVKAGDTVLQGQRIALVGSTGYATAPHLHFEVTINGRRADPLKFF